MTLVLTSEMVAQVIISIFRRSLEKLKWKFPSHSERWWTNQASMAMRKSSCKNTPQYLRSCCSPIGQNNTKDFSAQSGGSIGRAVWKWSGKSRFPGAFSASLVNLRRFISLPDLFPLAPTDRPWVSEDVLDPSTFDKKLHSAHASSGLFSWTNVDWTPERGRNRVYTHCSQKVCLLRFSVLIKMKLVKKNAK